jgi:drug/metabolite transporter (DMT)-like permease
VRDQDHTKLPEGRDLIFLLVGIIGIGTSGPLIALSTMPVLTLVFWRNLGGSMVIAPFAWRSLRSTLLDSRDGASDQLRRGLRWSIVAGIALAAHFAFFFTSMRLTSVAAGTALTALQPLFAAFFVTRLGGHIPRRAWIGMIISFIGLLVITGVDLTISLRAFAGDIAAIICAALAAIYVILGSRAQQYVSTSLYTATCYFTCSITALIAAVISGQQLSGFKAREWWLLLGLIAGAQILGHTMFNLTLRRVSPAIVSLIVFFEVPVSALLGYWWIGQLPPSGTIPGVILLLLGCAIFVLRNRTDNSLEEVKKQTE